MTDRTRDYLKPQFQDGERPSGTDFADLIDSFVNIASDGVSLDADGNLVLSRGLIVSNSNGTVAGGLRFSGGQMQFFDGTNWVSLTTGGAGAFQPLGATNSVAYVGTGNVGIGSGFTAAAPPQARLDVTLGPGSATEQVRFGNSVCCNGTGAFASVAMFCHQAHATDNDFAVRQTANGAVHVNSTTAQPISFRQNGTTVRMGVSAAGNLIVGGESELFGAAGQILQVAGKAFKIDGNASWDTTSDSRVKEDVRDLDAGLAELRKVRPVRFRYNGRAGTPANLTGVGVVAQEIETVFPETIQRVAAGVPGEPGLEDLRIFNPAALTFVLINAVKELANKVEQLEQALAEATPKRTPRGKSA